MILVCIFVLVRGLRSPALPAAAAVCVGYCVSLGCCLFSVSFQILAIFNVILAMNFSLFYHTFYISH